MTKREALAMFNDQCPRDTFLSRGYLDTVMRNEAWNNFTDALCKDGQITMRQYEGWANPWERG